MNSLGNLVYFLLLHPVYKEVCRIYYWESCQLALLSRRYMLPTSSSFYLSLWKVTITVDDNLLSMLATNSILLSKWNFPTNQPQHSTMKFKLETSSTIIAALCYIAYIRYGEIMEFQAHWKKGKFVYLLSEVNNIRMVLKYRLHLQSPAAYVNPITNDSIMSALIAGVWNNPPDIVEDII